MKKIKLYTGFVFLAIAAVIFLFVVDLRSVYSGGFFAAPGNWLIISSRRKSRSG